MGARHQQGRVDYGGLALPSPSPRRILCEIAEQAVPVLQEIAEKTWPRTAEVEARRFGAFGPVERQTVVLPDRYKIILRRYDLMTLKADWRLEAAGPIEFFEWSNSGRILDSYGVRFPMYSVRPVFDEVGDWSGFGINGRPPRGGGDRLTALDARMDCPLFVRSTSVSDLIAGLRTVQGKPRVEEARPGLNPTDAYVDLMRHVNRTSYFETRGTNQYLGPGWTTEALDEAFDDPTIRAVWIGDREPPKPEAH